MELREVIKEYRERNHYTMQEFADRCELSKGYISMLEKGKHPQSARSLVPSLETLQKIAKGMDTDLDTLVSVLDMDTLITVNPTGKGKPVTRSDGQEENEETIVLSKLSEKQRMLIKDILKLSDQEASALLPITEALLSDQ